MQQTIQPTLLRTATAIGLALAAATVSAQTTLTINTLGDDPDNDAGDGVCSTGELIGDPPPFIVECTLRAALEEANATNGPVTLEISQGIERTVATVSIIQVGTALPTVTNEIILAGDTHPDWTQDGATHLLLRGTSGGSFSGLKFEAGAAGSTVRSIGIEGSTGNGITIEGGDNYTIDSNVIGGQWTPTAYSYQGNASHGLYISSSGSNVISGNMIVASGTHGVRLRNDTASNVLRGNVIGLSRFSPSQPYAPQNGNQGSGVLIDGSAGAGNAVGFFSGNTIANNSASGVRVRADGQLVLGNRIGVPHEGEVAQGYDSEDYGNGQHGIQVTGSDNVIGSSGAGRNVIGHSATTGIDLTSGASNNEIAWNWIGTDPEGNDLGMSQGIQLSSGDDNLIADNDIAFNARGIYMAGGFAFIRRNTITDNGAGVQFLGPGQLGSTDIADANVIGNNGSGVFVFGSANGLIAIRNNYIGTDASGAILGNTAGITISGPNSSVWIGQNDGSGNVIVNSASSGINLRQGASDVIIAGNLVGVHPNGQPMGNQGGISFGNGSNGSNATGNRIGYDRSDVINPGNWMPGNGAGNVIAYNTEGVTFERADDDSTGNIIRGNSIHSNGTEATRGIDLEMEDLDVGGGASGPNNLMNYPDFDLSATAYNQATEEVDYRVRVQTTPANADYPLVLDFYLADGSSPQGKTFVGSLAYPASAAFEFRSGTLALPQGIPAGSWLVATATDVSGNTSQFTNEPIEMELPDSIFSDRYETP